MCPVPFSSFFLFTSSGACIVYTFPPLGIGCIPVGLLYTCGVVYAAFLFLFPYYPIFYSLYTPSTCSNSSFMCSLLSLVSSPCIAFTSIFLMQSSRNFPIWLDGSMMISTSAWPLLLFLVFCRTDHLHRFSSGCSSLLSSSFGRCSIISIRCARRSAHITPLSRHHDVSPYGSRGEGTRLKFFYFSSAVNLPVLKKYIYFWGTHNIPTYMCCPLAPLSPSAEFSGFPAVSVPESSLSALCVPRQTLLPPLNVSPKLQTPPHTSFLNEVCALLAFSSLIAQIIMD